MTRLFTLTVDGETFDVDRDGDSIQYSWVSGPRPGYGFAAGRSDGAAPTDDEAVAFIRGFLASIDPATGYVAE
ncbi:hypothetical protein [uncultured Microbacterium sp.]|uniref:hypothetical protein n=1 Tax=uncultured Microbacterium sp. TaxID=191216 RepID=UPI0028D4744F|nr:hypothetical protein [uncultured Microbacterium sp.]